MWNAIQSRPGFELVSPCPFPTTITITTARIHIEIYTYMRKTSLTGNDDFNKRTKTLLYKNINLSHFIFEKVMFVVCEKWVETSTDCYIDPGVLLSHLGWVTPTVGHWGPQSPQSASWFSLRRPVSKLTRTVRAPGYIIFYRPPASAVLPLIYTGASLDWRLGWESVYKTLHLVFFCLFVLVHSPPTCA